MRDEARQLSSNAHTLTMPDSARRTSRKHADRVAVGRDETSAMPLPERAERRYSVTDRPAWGRESGRSRSSDLGALDVTCAGAAEEHDCDSASRRRCAHPARRPARRPLR